MITLALVFYWLAVGGLFVYGCNCYVLCRAYRRGRKLQLPRLDSVRAEYNARIPDERLPAVTVQLPVYNERYVVERLLDAVAALDYPRDKLRVQVLDDSVDDTSARLAALVARHAGAGLTIEHLHRTHRQGFKAGALAAGLAATPDALLAIFDADFVPAPDVLRRCVPFFSDQRVGLVQARWGHVNRQHSWLTRLQGLAIDGHFGVEQAGRCWAGYLLNFNGTAGIWRRAAIEDAGGWTADTLTEDLDLSYRAQLAGWQVEYLPDTLVPAEIPADMAAFKSQQRRWAKGSIQTAKKLLGQVMRSPLPALTKLQAVLHLTHYLVHPLMLTVCLLSVPLLSYWDMHLGPLGFGVMLVLMALGAAGPSTLYLVSQQGLAHDTPEHHPHARQALPRMANLPLLMLVGTGIAVSNTRAVLEALVGKPSEFVRTPKRRLSDSKTAGVAGYPVPRDATFWWEAGLALYAAYGLLLYAGSERWLLGPFLALYAGGFALVAGCSARDMLRRKRVLRAAGKASRQEAAREPVWAEDASAALRPAIPARSSSAG